MIQQKFNLIILSIKRQLHSIICFCIFCLIICEYHSAPLRPLCSQEPFADQVKRCFAINVLSDIGKA